MRHHRAVAPTQEGRDQITLDVIYLLMALVTPITSVVVIEVAAVALFGLHSQSWHTVGVGALILGGLVSTFAVVWLSHDLKTGSDQ
jgi:hypothetical protein